jgi:hypothetical protein
MRLLLFLASMAAVLVPATDATAETAAEKALAQQIGRDLKESGQLRNYQIGVKYQEGIVWLGGTVANASQRETAVRLTQQMDGVARVVCQLRYPGDQMSNGGSQAPSNFNAFDDSQPAYAPNGSPVVHAFANGGAPNLQRRQAMMRANPQGRVNLASARNNMPLPSPRPAAGSAGPGVRQANAQGVYNAGGMYPQGCAPGAMGGAAGGMGMGGAAGGMGMDGAVPVGFVPHGMGRGPSYDNASMPGYAWPSYASYPNYAALTYPKQYSPTAWPYIGPFYPYPQVPLAWRKVSLEWDDGWWFLDFSAHNSSH